MFKKILASVGLLSVLLLAGVRAEASDIDEITTDEVIEESTEIQEADVDTDELIYEQTKPTTAQNDANEIIERLEYCNNNDFNTSNENIEQNLRTDIILNQTNKMVQNVSDSIVETTTIKEEEKRIEREIGDTLYDSFDVDVDDEILLATIIYCEAGNQSYEGKVAVGNVVLNRVASPRFPNSIRAVIYQSGQFEPVGMGWYDRELRKEHVNESCLQAARDALNGVNIVGDRLFFHVYKGNEDGLIIGAHIFK